MAELIGLKERQLALADINSKLKDLVQVNAFINDENPSGVYKLSFGQHRISILCPDGSAVRNLVLAHKQRMVTKIRELAQKHEIELNDQDEAILS